MCNLELSRSESVVNSDGDPTASSAVIGSPVVPEDIVRLQTQLIIVRIVTIVTIVDENYLAQIPLLPWESH